MIKVLKEPLFPRQLAIRLKIKTIINYLVFLSGKPLAESYADKRYLAYSQRLLEVKQHHHSLQRVFV